MVSALVVGSNGNAGRELVRLLSKHPKISSLQTIGGRSKSKSPVSKFHVEAEGIRIPRLLLGKSDVVFTATPAGAAGKLKKELAPGIKLIDLSDELRPPGNGEAVYGMSEISRERIKGATIVANPGCYPTSITLALAPLLAFGLVETGGITVFSQSGYTGAGKNAKILDGLEGNSKFYNITGHRHMREMESFMGIEMLSFTPCAMPYARGLVSAISATKSEPERILNLRDIYNAYYEDERFVHFMEGRPPCPSDVRGTNNCLIHAVEDGHSGTIKIISAIDNLVKGAAGQAVQNMNIMFGFGEAEGLPTGNLPSKPF